MDFPHLDYPYVDGRAQVGRKPLFWRFSHTIAFIIYRPHPDFPDLDKTTKPARLSPGGFIILLPVQGHETVQHRKILEW